MGIPFLLCLGDGGGVFAGGGSKQRRVATIVKSNPHATLVAFPIGYFKSEMTGPGYGSPSGSTHPAGPASDL